MYLYKKKETQEHYVQEMNESEFLKRHGMKYDEFGADNSLETSKEAISVIMVAWKVNEVYLNLLIAKRLKKKL